MFRLGTELETSQLIMWVCQDLGSLVSQLPQALLWGQGAQV